MNRQIENVRVRFAPSPTGNLHLGSLRAALFNWLFAKHNKGTFLIRIEDTDPVRSKPEYEQSILDSFRWASIDSDEPIVRQSERTEIYRQVVDKLLSEGKAYRCYCPASSDQDIDGDDYSKYDQKCRNLRSDELDLNAPHTIRFKLPDGLEKVEFDDLIRGHVSFEIDQFDDFIIMRTDGTFMYNFVVVVDDADSSITHILRGEEHLSNTPKQILLNLACGYDVPEFGHIPLILGPTGSKLSKRDAATSVLDYKKNGFLADALCNYLVRLGWSHGDQEIFSRQEMIEYFSLDHVGKKGAIFDPVKLEWVNSVYIKNLDSQDLLDLIERDVDTDFLSRVKNWSKDQLLKAVDLYKDRVKTLSELVGSIENVYNGTITFNEIEVSPELIENIYQLLFVTEDFSVENLSTIIKSFCKNLGLRLPAVAQPIRVALTGSLSSPGVFDLLNILTKEESLKRLEKYKEFIIKKVEG